MFRFTPIALSLALFACGGGSDGGSSKPAAVITNTSNSLTITGDDQTQTFNKPETASIIITGNANAIVVKSNVSSLSITGNSNMIDIGPGVTVGSCIVTGDKNSLTKSGNLPIKCTVAGANNTGFN